MPKSPALTMRLPLEFFACDDMARDTVGRMTWVNSRTNDLYRLVQGVKDAATRVMDEGAPMSELDAALGSLQARLRHIRDHAAAVDALRGADKVTRPSR
jgi:hypothetical protein